jgi:hypothetical protein
MVYLDTSFIAPLFIAEDTSDDVKASQLLGFSANSGIS